MKRLLLIVALVVLGSGLVQGQTLDGIWEGEIQDQKRPLVINVDFKALSVSFSGAAPANITQPALSGEDKTVKFEVVIGQQVLKFAGRQNGARITGEVDTGHRQIPFWLELLPSLPKPTSPGDAWRQDIDVVVSRFLRYDRSFSELKRAAVRMRLQALRAKVDRMSDQAIMVVLARAVAMSGNAHTRALPYAKPD